MTTVDWRVTGFYKGERVIGSCPVCKQPITGEGLCPMIYCDCPTDPNGSKPAHLLAVLRDLRSKREKVLEAEARNLAFEHEMEAWAREPRGLTASEIVLLVSFGALTIYVLCML